jgi:hypothetical protein
MPVRVANFAGVLLVLILLAAPIAAHVALVTQRGTVVAGVLVAAQAALVAWIGSFAIPSRALRAGAAGLLFLFVLVLSRFVDGGPLAASAVPHAMAYLAW